MFYGLGTFVYFVLDIDYNNFKNLDMNLILDIGRFISGASLYIVFHKPVKKIWLKLQEWHSQDGIIQKAIEKGMEIADEMD